MGRCQIIKEQDMMFKILNYTQKQISGQDGEDFCISDSGSSCLAYSDVSLELSELWQNVGWSAVLKKGKINLS